jgi:hypothetical protein
MPSSKIVKTRKPGWCAAEFAHPSKIEVGDRVMVTTYFPSDDTLRDSPVRYRFCSWCVAAAEQEAAWLLAKREPASHVTDRSPE